MMLEKRWSGGTGQSRREVRVGGYDQNTLYKYMKFSKRKIYLKDKILKFFL